MKQISLFAVAFASVFGGFGLLGDSLYPKDTTNSRGYIRSSMDEYHAQQIFGYRHKPEKGFLSFGDNQVKEDIRYSCDECNSKKNRRVELEGWKNQVPNYSRKNTVGMSNMEESLVFENSIIGGPKIMQNEEVDNEGSRTMESTLFDTGDSGADIQKSSNLTESDSGGDKIVKIETSVSSNIEGSCGCSGQENSGMNTPHRNKCVKEHRNKKKKKKEKCYSKRDEYHGSTYDPSDANIVGVITDLLRRVPSIGDYNSVKPTPNFSYRNYPKLRIVDINRPLKLLSRAGKTGSSTDMKLFLKHALLGLQKGPTRLSEFIKLINVLLKNYSVFLKHKMKKGSLEIRDKKKLREKMYLYAKSFRGNEESLVQLIKLLLQELKSSSDARHKLSSTISLLINFSTQCGIRKVGYGYRPLETAIRRFTIMLERY
ncbi:hypothetical protein AYI68_g6039 [Smittium mucronatum]|uniref:Uncharacterized protein n=1 Tax=Smittium mucronatum TaxID=133383 RepID=A0A1R0GSK5_9FUNG|nr:hypothetical protein AYI68_g6039 [Smittium mucronatum]